MFFDLNGQAIFVLFLNLSQLKLNLSQNSPLKSVSQFIQILNLDFGKKALTLTPFVTLIMEEMIKKVQLHNSDKFVVSINFIFYDRISAVFGKPTEKQS